MKFSLVTACLNSAATIRDTIESVASQSHADIEHIVIDGGSSDDTLSIVSEHGRRVAKVVSEKDGGIYSAMNKGIALASGEVIGTINADDFYADSDVIAQVARLFDDSGADCVFGDLEYVHPRATGKVLRRWRSRPYRVGAFQRGWHPAHPTFFARRAIYARLGGFDESLQISADYELMLRFLVSGKASSAYLPSVLVKMRDGGVSNRTLANILRANVECYRAFAKNGLHASPLVMLMKPLSKVRQMFTAGQVLHRAVDS